MTTKLIKIIIGPMLLLMSGAASAQTTVPRYELGGQFSLLSLNQPSKLVTNGLDPGFVRFAPSNRKRTEPGIGGRFTYNLTSYLALEAEGNIFPRSEFEGSPATELAGRTPGGRVFQGQFGVKAGKRFHRIGIFGKVRPGFVGFTSVTKLLSTSTVPNAPGLPPFVVGRFGGGKQLYYSTDLGVVVEHYISRRIFTRFDLGDTIIHYSAFAGAGTFLSRAIITRPPETKHNLQFNAGVGFRF